MNSISKEEISTLQTAVFEGRIIVVQTLVEAQKAIQYLQKFDIVGFDTETKPSFKKGLVRKIALIQLSVEDTCFLFRTNLIGIPEALDQYLSNPDIKKIGLSLKDDFSAIRKRVESFQPAGFVELQTLVKKYGIQEAGLQRIYALLFGKRISKGQRLTNWEADVLTASQQKYAALDAWACLQIYNKLIKLDIDL